MKKVVRITESDLTKIVKRVLVETKEEVKKQISQKVSLLKSVGDVNNYLNELSNQYAPKSDKLVLIFPGYGQYSVVATAVYVFGINAQVFTSVNDCISVMNKLSSKGKKYREIYIGSHGGGKEGLLYSIDEENNSTLFNGFIESLSKLTIPGQTKILFSACGGGDSGRGGGYYLKKIAEATGSTVYGSEGTFDWVSNKSEGTLWVCPSNPPTKEWSKYLNNNLYGCKRASSAPFSWS